MCPLVLHISALICTPGTALHACWLAVGDGGRVVVEQRSTKKARLQFNDAGDEDDDDDEPNNKKGSCAAAQTVELNWHKRL